jgi:hypothetical protein
MRRFAVLCYCAAAVVGCAKSENKAPAANAMPAPPPALSLSDVAGKWSMKAMTEARDTTLVTYEMYATADTSGWTITFPNRKPIAARVSGVGGDSLVIDAGPYESVLRKGVQVSTHGVLRLQNGNLVGLTLAHYKTAKSDSVRHIVTEGTRAP